MGVMFRCPQTYGHSAAYSEMYAINLHKSLELLVAMEASCRSSYFCSFFQLQAVSHHHGVICNDI